MIPKQRQFVAFFEQKFLGCYGFLDTSQAFSIALNNLVRNAFEHTRDAQDPITILAKEHELLVPDQLSSDSDGRHTPTEASSSQGYGLGQGIVQRLCERNGWTFSLHGSVTFVCGLFTTGLLIVSIF